MVWTLVMLAGLAQAKPHFGAGVSIGDPTGVTVGYRGNAWSGAQAAVGLDDGRFDLHGDYLQTVKVVEPGGKFQVPLYVGAGVGFQTGEKGIFGAPAGIVARVPLGASLLFPRTPVEIYAQVVPTFRVVPSNAFGLDLGVGGRYYF